MHKKPIQLKEVIFVIIWLGYLGVVFFSIRRECTDSGMPWIKLTLNRRNQIQVTVILCLSFDMISHSLLSREMAEKCK